MYNTQYKVHEMKGGWNVISITGAQDNFFSYEFLGGGEWVGGVEGRNAIQAGDRTGKEKKKYIEFYIEPNDWTWRKFITTTKKTNINRPGGGGGGGGGGGAGGLNKIAVHKSEKRSRPDAGEYYYDFFILRFIHLI